MSYLPRRISRFARTGVLLYLTAAVAAPAIVRAAGEERTLQAMVYLNRRALAAHAAGRHLTAKKLLLDALSRGHSASPQSHVMSARTSIHLGIVSIVGLKQRDEGLAFFAQGLRLRPDIKLTPKLATPALQADFELVRAKASTWPAPAEAPAPPPLAIASSGKPKELASTPARSRGNFPKAEEPDVPPSIPEPLYCPTPLEGPPGQDVNLLCITQREAPVTRVVAYYRPAAGDRYTALPMNRSKKGWYSALIPSKEVTGRSLQFYFEAHGKGEAVALRNGKEESPNVIVLKPGAPPVGAAALAAMHTGPASAEERKPVGQAAAELEEREGAQAERLARQRRRAPGTIWLGLGVGSGLGWHGRRPLEAYPDRSVTTGLSSLGLGHLVPEVGWQLNEKMVLSLQSRHQFLPVTGADEGGGMTLQPPRTAHALLARMQYIAWTRGDLELLGTAALGAGSALRMKVAPARDLGVVTSDTVVLGPVVGGVGVGASYTLNDRLLALAETRVFAAVWRPGLMLELNAGVQYRF